LSSFGEKRRTIKLNASFGLEILPRSDGKALPEAARKKC